MVIKFVTLFLALATRNSTKGRGHLRSLAFYFSTTSFCVRVLGRENTAFFPPNGQRKAFAVESTKSIKIRMPEQSNDYRVVTFGSGGVGKSSLGECSSRGGGRAAGRPRTDNSPRRAKPKLIFSQIHFRWHTGGANVIPRTRMFYSYY